MVTRTSYCTLLLLSMALVLGLAACGGTRAATPAPPAAPTATFTASASTITANQEVTLTWQTSNATSVSIAPAVSASALATSGTAKVKPTQTTTYTLTASGSGGTVTQTVTITVSQPPPSITSFTASATSVTSGQPIKLTWQTSNATSITITKALDSGQPSTLTTSTQAQDSYTDTNTITTATAVTYVATATGPTSPPATQKITLPVVQPVPPQITSFTATPAAVIAGQTTTITWATTNASTVTITPSILGDDVNGLGTSGTQPGVTVQQTTTFTLTATGNAGQQVQQNVTVTVEPYTLTLSASPNTVPAGQAVALNWTSTGTINSLTIADANNKSICGTTSPCTLPSGTASDMPANSTTYTATAIGADGIPVTVSTSVTVGSAAVGKIKHIIFMLQENRSFDNYFGVLGAYRAQRLGQFGITATAGDVNGFDPNVVLTNTHDGSRVQPFHEKTACTDNLTPSWNESHYDVALNGGASQWANTTAPGFQFSDSMFSMNGFLDTTTSVPASNDPHGTRAMGYYDQTDLPYYYDLATFFATSDDWHSPLLSATPPNRMYLMAASSFGHAFSDDGGHPAYSAKTIFRALNEANVGWLYYYKDSVFLANFADWNDPTIQTRVFPIKDYLNRLAGACGGVPGSCDPDQALPRVVFIDSASGIGAQPGLLDEHPNANESVQAGAAYVQSIIQPLMNSDAWQDSVFILTYDEGGGLYDHVPPVNVPMPDQWAPGNCPDPVGNFTKRYCTSSGSFRGTFNVSGFRVPLIVISPWAKPHFVSHTPRDWTAILAFIEKTFNIPALTARDAYFQDPSRSMDEFFDFTQSTAGLLNAPGGKPWTQFLPQQPTTGVCNTKLEAGPTM
jgi:phospholipase C